MVLPTSNPMNHRIQPGANAISERHIVGINLGQFHDPTVIGVVHRIDYVDFSRLFQVIHLERLSLGMPYPDVVDHMTRVLERPALRDSEDVELVIGCAEDRPAVFDVFRRMGVMTTKVILIDDGRSSPPWRNLEVAPYLARRSSVS